MTDAAAHSWFKDYVIPLVTAGTGVSYVSMFVCPTA